MLPRTIRFTIFSMVILTMLATACAQPTPETIVEKVETTVEVEVPVEVTKEVPVEVLVTPTPSMEHELTVALGSLPNTLTANLTPSLSAEAVMRQLFDTLLHYDEQTGEFVPYLAESWELIDGDTWRFHLRKDVVFHNGEPFDARSVKTTFDFIMDPDGQSTVRERLAELAEYTIVDDYTVDFRMDPPVGVFLYGFDRAQMLPPDYFAEVGPEAFADAPVGTGPYKFKEWRRDDFATLERFDDYWGPKSVVKTVTFLHRPEGVTRVAALEAGEVDVAYLLPPEDVPALLNKGFNIYSGYIGQALTVWLSPKAPPLRDQKVRQAIQYAVDVESIWRSIAGGYGRLLDCQMGGPDGFGYNPDLKPYPYDPDKARELLAEAGYPNGFTVTGTATMGRYYRDKEAMQAIVGYLADVGITLELEFLESGAWLDKLRAGNLEPVWDCGMTYAGRDPGMQLGTRLDWPEQNKTGEYDDAAFKEMWYTQHTTSDPETRRKLIQELHVYVCDQAYGIFLYQIPAIYGISPRVQGLEFGTSYNIELADAVVAP